jgi:DNA-binding response OmpR family regulator
MPILNGLQTLSVLNSEPRFDKVPKVILTTSDSDENKTKLLSKGAVDYFVKPSNMKDFVSTAEKMLRYCQ